MYFDGACRGNPGISGIGVVIYNLKKEVYNLSKYIGNNYTNNESEYISLYLGLIFLINNNIKEVTVYGDSLLVISQMTGKYKVKAENLKYYYDKCKELIINFNCINFVHILRKYNTIADKLANDGINERNYKYTWKDKLLEWENGKFQTYPLNIKKCFFYETSFISSGEEEYLDNFIESNDLELITQDYTDFESHLLESENKYVTSFWNKNKNVRLVVPIQRINKNFKSMKDFIDNASELQQKEFWKEVSIQINKLINNKDKFYISTHGLGVYYFHLRIEKNPKYYITEEYIY